MKIFICGSKMCANLPEKAKKYITCLCHKNHSILIGDCYGIDLSVQQHLYKSGYQNVVVYTACNKARNNVGRWQEISVSTDKTGFEAHREKDKAMIADCDCGIAIWDGISKGTRMNTEDLKSSGKRVVIYSTVS